MPQVYLRTPLYDKIVQSMQDVTQFVNQAVEEKLKKEEKQGAK